ncbi:MAG: ROK family protein [Gemmataceae bacterium]
MNETPLFVGLDVGGTTMKAGVVDDNGKPLSTPATLPTEAGKGQEHGLGVMAETIRQAAMAAHVSMDEIAAIGVATPGSMDIAAGLILDPPNLKPWRNVPVRQFIADTFGLPTAFQNDANAAALGEFWVGAGKEYRSMVLFTLGTGIGGGIVIGDQILEGEHSHGGELGHIKIEMTRPRLCGCGKRGCLEAYASATAIVQRTHEALNADDGRSSLHAVVRATGELTAKDVFQAAAAGDALAAAIVDDTAKYLAIGAANLMHVIDPQVIAFAGGMTAAGEPLLNAIRAKVHDYAFAVPATMCQIRYAQLGSDAGFIGAAGCGRLLWQKVKNR